MPKFVIAPDSFKECLTAKQAAKAIARGLRAHFGRGAELCLLPIADGGEGTLEAVTAPRERVRCRVTGPTGKPVRALFGLHNGTAIVEMARAAGLPLAQGAARRAALTTTYGVGELMRRALDRGADHILLTVGGSATNDGGCGMFAALGARFCRADGTAFVPTGGTLSDIAAIDRTALDPRLAHTRITVATDVRTPLLGDRGATRLFAPQKGATQAELDQMEAGMAHYADLLAKECGRDVAMMQGCGAAGGIAAPLAAFLGAQLVSGIDAVLETLSFSEALAGADAVITGEGKMDAQSLCGKAVSGVVRAAHDIPVYAFVGCLGDTREHLREPGLADVFAVRERAVSDADSMKHAARYLRAMAREFAEGFCGGPF